MKSLQLPPAKLTSTYAHSFHSLWISCRCRTFNHRALSSSSAGRISPHQGAVPLLGDVQFSFEHLGISNSVTSSLRKAYPNVHHPTATQQEFIPAILDRQDVLLKDNTGSGKSFGILLALLSKKRAHSSSSRNGGHSRITSLLIVPHRDLAYQYLHWAERIHACMNSPTSLPSLAQVVVRNAANPIAEQIKNIRSAPPHVLIGTPQALCDVLEQDEQALMLRYLSTVVVDEADYLIESLPRAAKDKYALLKARKAMNRHPSPTRQLLDRIYGPFQPSYDLPQQGDGRKPVGPGSDAEVGFPRPQLILSSATLRVQLRNFVIRSSGWLTKQRGRLATVTGQNFSSKESVEGEAVNTIGGGAALRHYALVISDGGEINNIAGAIASSEEDTVPTESSAGAVVQSVGGDASETLRQSEQVQNVAESSRKPLPLHILEAIGEAFALDVPRVALLVLPASAPLVQIVDELGRIGVNAQGLDVVHDQTGRAYMAQESSGGASDTPVLLVATLASMRGLDLPELTHVFIAGVATVDSYLHAAGRVGRFGRGGKVISVLEARHGVVQDNGVNGWKDDPTRMLRIYRTIGVRPRKLEHFN
ncbi:P-loop containing nucleoside triphosphate hydrolase protein [Amylocystis lapponica]|nr:P-loop containing nucleoside triphosphate hydrolase protein [Amylocystis lapponica]